MKRREEILEERRRLKAQYGKLFDDISALLFRHDPIGIAFENPNCDEYDPEAGTILPGLRLCKSPEDVAVVVHEQFSRWFSEEIAGAREHYTKVAAEIWELWQSYPFRVSKPNLHRKHGT